MILSVMTMSSCLLADQQIFSEEVKEWINGNGELDNKCNRENEAQVAKHGVPFLSFGQC